MVRKIIWTALAKQSRREILNFPNLGKNSGFNEIQYLIVDVYKIYYKVISEGILILLIWDGRRNPDKLKAVLLNL